MLQTSLPRPEPARTTVATEGGGAPEFPSGRDALPVRGRLDHYRTLETWVEDGVSEIGRPYSVKPLRSYSHPSPRGRTGPRPPSLALSRNTGSVVTLRGLPSEAFPFPLRHTVSPAQSKLEPVKHGRTRSKRPNPKSRYKLFHTKYLIEYIFEGHKQILYFKTKHRV